MGPRFNALVARQSHSANEIVYLIYLELYARGNRELAMKFILTFCNSFPNARDLIYLIGIRIYRDQDLDVGANLLMNHIYIGGDKVEAFENCLNYCVGKGHAESAIALFEDFSRRFNRALLPQVARYNVGTVYMQRRDFAQAFDIFESLVEEQCFMI